VLSSSFDLHHFCLQITVMPTNSSITARTARYNARSAIKEGRSMSLITSRTRSRTKLEGHSTQARLQPAFSKRSQATLKATRKRNSSTRSPFQRTLPGHSAEATLQGSGALPEQQPEAAMTSEPQADILLARYVPLHLHACMLHTLHCIQFSLLHTFLTAQFILRTIS